MSDKTQIEDPGSVWRHQPAERLPVNLQQIVNRRTRDLAGSTRSEILMSIAAALLLAGVVAWRLRIAHEGIVELAIAAALAWVAISLYGFRRRIWPGGHPPGDAVAATGLEYYRTELERRRDHLRNEWLWHGPLFLASAVLVGVFAGRRNIAFQPLRNILPLLVLLAAWTVFGIWRRRLQARELQREIDELTPLGPGGRGA